ncbi:hypothetical protein F5141DRAFT_1238127 [Pisolithus sp. B1]|nr:hypothetical protein F5141DRAFT_1238127 [Pisolithus sp. B1]
MQMEDPNLAIRPDFSSEDFLDACQQLTNDVVDDDQAARILGTLWDIQNTKDVQRWNVHKDEETQLARDQANQAVEELAEWQHCWQDEEEAAHAEECKKNKTKYAPIPDIKVPSGPVNIPAPYATCKLKKGKYSLMLLKSDNGQHVWVPASNTRDKSAVIKDEDLTWEQFGKASVHLLSAMWEHDWQKDRIDMHLKFWTALEVHPWRRSSRNHLKQVLLLYQSQQLLYKAQPQALSQAEPS